MALDKVKDDMLQDNLVFPGSTAQFPSLTTTQRNALSGVQPGTLIYNSTVGKLQQYDGNNAWGTIDAPPVITSVTYPTESGAVLTALDATGSSDAAQTLIINGSNFSSTSEISVQIQVSGTYVAFASSVSVNGARTQITCTGVTKRAAADGYVIKVTNVTGLSATTTVNFNADPSFSTAANLGTVYAGTTLSKSIAFTGTKVIQGATAKPTWMTVTGNTSTADNGSGDTTFDATGSPATLGGTIANSGTSQTHTFSIIVRDAENQTFNRDYSLTAIDYPTGGTIVEPGSYTGGGYRSHTFLYAGNGGATNTFTLYGATTVDILLVGGGGGAYPGDRSGGGGAGAFVPLTSQSWPAGTYTMTVGVGGSNSTTHANNNGGETSVTYSGSGSFTALYARGGGAGGHTTASNSSPDQTNPTKYGGSGGGQGTTGSSAGTGGSNGNNGGNNNTSGGGNSITAGGGGGAGGNGSNATANKGGEGGSGSTNYWRDGNTSGTTAGTHVFAAGGGGGAFDDTGGDGGTASGTTLGGNGGRNGVAATQGVDGTGSGAGGSGSSGLQPSRGGGHGVIILRYAV